MAVAAEHGYDSTMAKDTYSISLVFKRGLIFFRKSKQNEFFFINNVGGCGEKLQHQDHLFYVFCKLEISTVICILQLKTDFCIFIVELSYRKLIIREFSSTIPPRSKLFYVFAAGYGLTSNFPLVYMISL